MTGPIVKDVIRRTLAGESLWSIVRDLEARGVPAPQVQENAAKSWRPQQLRVTISSPSYAGLRTHQGTVIGLIVVVQLAGQAVAIEGHQSVSMVPSGVVLMLSLVLCHSTEALQGCG